LYDESSNELIRVDWHGKEQGANYFDPSKRVYAFLEFEKSMSRHMPRIKGGMLNAIELVPIDHDMKRIGGKKGIGASHVTVKHDSDDTIVVGWSPFLLEKGQCYKLMFNGQSGNGWNDNPLASMLRPEVADAEDMHVCMSECDCDVIGTAECI
jgi:hypothetical protein